MKRSTLIEPTDSGEPRTVGETVYRKLRQDIIWGQLPPGAPLRSDELRVSYDVGISPLREALSRLVAERLVTSIGHRGFRVASLTAEDVNDVMETRLVVEKHALSQSLTNGGIEWERELVASYHALSHGPFPDKPGNETEAWVGYHRAFHMALIAACGSRWQIDMASLLFDQAERHRAVRARIVPKQKLKRDVTSEHSKIFKAALARDRKNALAALEEHYRTTAQHVVAALQHVPKIDPNSKLNDETETTGASQGRERSGPGRRKRAK